MTVLTAAHSSLQRYSRRTQKFDQRANLVACHTEQFSKRKKLFARRTEQFYKRRKPFCSTF